MAYEVPLSNDTTCVMFPVQKRLSVLSAGVAGVLFLSTILLRDIFERRSTKLQKPNFQIVNDDAPPSSPPLLLSDHMHVFFNFRLCTSMYEQYICRDLWDPLWFLLSYISVFLVFLLLSRSSSRFSFLNSRICMITSFLSERDYPIIVIYKM